MFKCKYCFLGVIVGLLFSVLAVSVEGQTFKSSDFLEMKDTARTSYIAASASMAGVIASQNNGKQATCIDRWVATHQTNGYRSVLQAMRRFGDYHPQAVILAVLREACGTFEYGKQ